MPITGSMFIGDGLPEHTGKRYITY